MVKYKHAINILYCERFVNFNLVIEKKIIYLKLVHAESFEAVHTQGI